MLREAVRLYPPLGLNLHSTVDSLGAPHVRRRPSPCHLPALRVTSSPGMRFGYTKPSAFGVDEPFTLSVGERGELVCCGVIPSGMLRYPLFLRWRA